MSSDDHVTANPGDLPTRPMLPPDALQAEPPDSLPVLDVIPVEPPRPPRPPRPHPGFWWAFLWVIGFLILMNGIATVVVILGAVIRAFTSGNPSAYLKRFEGFNPDKPPEELVFLMMPALIAGEVFTIAVAWLAVRLVVGREWPRRLAFRLPSMTHLILALFSLPGLICLANLIVILARQFMHWLRIPDIENQAIISEVAKMWPAWLCVLVIGVGPGIGEELFCRGFLGRGLVGRWGPAIGILMTSFWFGVLHVDPALILGTGVIGLWLHYVYLNGRSLLLAMLLHFSNNALSVLISAGVLSEPLPNPEGAGWWTYAGGIVLLGCIGWAVLRTRTRLVTPGGGPGWQPPFPGVECPPPGSGTVVEHPWPDWLSVYLALLGVAIFAGGHYLGTHGG